MELVGALVFDKYLPLIFMILTPSFTFTFFQPQENPLQLAKLTALSDQYMIRVLPYHQSCCIKHSIYTVLISVLCAEIEKADVALAGSQL